MSLLTHESYRLDGRRAWPELAKVMGEEAAYCGSISSLYHTLFGSLHAWTREIAEGDTVGAHRQAFKAAIDNCFRGRTFNYRYEAPLLIAAAIHRHVLTGTAGELGRYYASASGTFDPAADAEGMRTALQDFLASQSAEFERTLSRQRLQTNAIARSIAWLLPYLALNLRDGRDACTVVELGCSAGLNLIADRYAWRVSIGDTERVAFESATGPALSVRLSGSLGWLERAWSRQPEELAPITRRFGCDLNVPRIEEPDDFLALESCVWGDKPSKLAELRTAAQVMQQFRGQGGHVELAESDAVRWVSEMSAAGAEALGEGERTVVLFNTVVTTYIDDAQYELLKTRVAEAMRGPWKAHRCYWVELEPPRRDGELEGAPAGSEAVIRAHTLEDGELRTRIVGSSQLHPREVTWLPAMDQLTAARG